MKRLKVPYAPREPHFGIVRTPNTNAYEGTTTVIVDGGILAVWGISVG